ncbi:copper homeostasis protein CutC [Pedobacter mucosus]|uniref:copper homeostasis protein CutC n=1 Tax=Pedobacter mucosus TaxID=2895286 RepID=UPI001EE43D53|nr:copper homeostasis protein CutC [Pedobacter mucosus]UKT65592.1 copper homeostasis protein CutC [Pedobacter mucosus]
MTDKNSNSASGDLELEICANGYESALAAQNGGAIRVELCDNLAEGGTTPSFAQIALSKKNLSIEIWPIIRPRGGDFLYSNLEFELMKEDIKICKSLSCEGVVFGILRNDGSIDMDRCSELIALAKPMSAAFHRAFDMSNNLEKALEDLIELGFVRVLSSGGTPSALQGTSTLARLIKQAKGRITIMPGAGINENNIQSIIDQTGAKAFHASAKDFVTSHMKYQNDKTKMGSIENEYQYELTSVDNVNALVKIMKMN